MKTRSKFNILCLTLLMGSAANAQDLPDLVIEESDYKTSIGLRAGETSGLTFKHFFTGQDAIDVIAGAWHHGLSLTAMYERSSNAFGVPGLIWYYGGGGHISMATTQGYYYYRDGNRRAEFYRHGSLGLGVDGVFGMEFKIPKAPIAVSLDVKPYIEFITTGGIWTSLDPGLGVKITL